MTKKADKTGFWYSVFPNQLGNLCFIVFLLGLVLFGLYAFFHVNVFDPDEFKSTDERIPELGTRRVVDEAGVLTQSEIDTLTRQIDVFEAASGGQMAVLLIRSLYGDAVEDFSLAVAEKWKIGWKGKDNGILLLLAMEDRRSRLEIGYGLEGDIKKAITYYEDPHELVGKADFVMANPPFNVDEIDADKIKNDPRLPFGLPSVNDKGKVSNGNYVWISYFYSYLNDTGRAGFVMAAGAESSGRGDALVRQKLVETGAVDVMVSIRSNFFYTRSVPCVLWFLNRAKKTEEQKDSVLMIDARNVYRKVTRKINDFSPEQEQNLLAIVWLYRGETARYKKLLAEYRKNGEDEAAAWLEERFPDAQYRDVEGLVKAVSRKDIAANDWSLTPGRYVGVAETDEGDEDFAEKFAALHEELRQLDAEAAKLAKKIDANFKELMG